MDVRPVDTDIIVSTRSRIRLLSCLSLLCVFIYLPLQQSFSGAHISYLHLLHVFIQPVVLLTSLLDLSGLPKSMAVVVGVMVLVDACVAILSFISVQRCFKESTATCFERVYEKGTWFALASILTAFDLFAALQLFSLHSQLRAKDVHEQAEVERIKTTNDLPSFNSIVVFRNKTRVINTFMIVIDVAYVLAMMNMVENTPLYFLSFGHILFDPFLLFFKGGYAKDHWLLVRIIYFVLTGLNLLLIVIQLQVHIVTYWSMLALLISIVFLLTDTIQIVYITQIINAIDKQVAFKRRI